jgi:hypothetical protein
LALRSFVASGLSENAVADATRSLARDNRLSNWIFKSFDDIFDHCCDAWNKLVDQPWKIMSIGLRD